MTSTDIYQTLVKTDPFELLEPDVLQDLATRITAHQYAPNRYVFKQGDVSLDCLFIIVSGLVEITVTNDRGLESVVGLRRAFDFFGETVVLSRQRYPAGARVREKLVCLHIQRTVLERLIYTYSDFSGFFNALLTERMRLLYEEMISEQSYETYSGLELPLFQKRVSEVMSYPVITCGMEDSITHAARLMAEKDISAVVVLDADNRPRGVVTEKNLVKYVIADLVYPVEQCRVEHVLNSNLLEINPEAFIGQALVTMIRSKTRSLIVMERGNLVGIITMVDLLKSRSTGTLLLTQNIETQPDFKSLALISHEVDNVLKALVTEKASVTEILEVTSEVHERMNRRVIQLAEERMKLEGWGVPPVDYCWLNLGSAARYEQALRSDQDHAILYDNPPTYRQIETDRYFARLAHLIVEGLTECGFNPCADTIMATRASWRRSLQAWQMDIDQGLETRPLTALQRISILLDARPVWGNLTLGETFRQYIIQAFAQALRNDSQTEPDKTRYKMPITFLGTFITEAGGPHKNQMNIKKTAIVHIVNSIRILAVGAGITEPSSLGRINLLVESGLLSAQEGDFYRTSLETLLMFQIRENLEKVKQGRQPDNYIDPYSLRKRERLILKDALAGVSAAQKRVQDDYGAFWLNFWMAPRE